jgi:hypothetical protein
LDEDEMNEFLDDMDEYEMKKMTEKSEVLILTF